MEINELLEILSRRLNPPYDEGLTKYPITGLPFVVRNAITHYYNPLSTPLPPIEQIKEYLGCKGRVGSGRSSRSLTDQECVNCWTLDLSQASQRPTLCSERGCVFFNHDHYLSHIRDNIPLAPPPKSSLLEIELSKERVSGRPETMTPGILAKPPQESFSRKKSIDPDDQLALWGWAYREINPHGRNSRLIQFPPWPLTFWFKFLASIENPEQKIDLANFWAFDSTPKRENCDVCRLCSTQDACENCLPGVLLHNKDDVSRFAKANRGNSSPQKAFIFPYIISTILNSLRETEPNNRGYLLLVGQAIREGSERYIGPRR